MLTGVYAARNITGERHDVWSVNTEKEYHEEGQVARLRAGDRLVPTSVSAPVEDAIAQVNDDFIEAAFAKLDPLALGTAVGVVGGLAVFIATAVALFEGGSGAASSLALFGNYLFGFEVSWPGAFVGLCEGGLMGFAAGALAAGLRNWLLNAYARMVRWRSEVDKRRDFLDKV